MYWSQYRGVYTRAEARTMRSRDREIEKTPTEFSSLKWGMERTTILDIFTGTIQEVSNASKKMNSTSFHPVHTKHSHVISELGSGTAINTHVIKKWQVVFQIIDWGTLVDKNPTHNSFPISLSGALVFSKVIHTIVLIWPPSIGITKEAPKTVIHPSSLNTVSIFLYCWRQCAWIMLWHCLSSFCSQYQGPCLQVYPWQWAKWKHHRNQYLGRTSHHTDTRRQLWMTEGLLGGIQITPP